MTGERHKVASKCDMGWRLTERGEQPVATEQTAAIGFRAFRAHPKIYSSNSE